MTLRDRLLSAVSSYKPKQTKSNEYRLNSPLRPGSDSHAFVITFEDEERGVWYDHVTNEGGTLTDLAVRLGIAERPRREVATTKRGYQGLDDYARAHGVPPEVFRNAQWREVMKSGRPALEFPTRGGARWRFIDGNQPAYMSINGYKKCWYGFNESLFGLLNLGYDLVICNGEATTVTAQAYGLAAICVTSGEGAIPDDLLKELQELLSPYPNAKVIIALDCDKKGRDATEKVYRQLHGIGLNITAVDLGLTDGGDLADFLNLYGWENMGEASLAFQQLPTIPIAIEQAPHRRRWQIIHADDLGKLPPVKWLVKGQIPDNGITIIYGASGHGKSFVTLDYALRVAQSSPVVYVAGEGESGYHGRVQAWCNWYSRPAGKLYFCLGAVSLLDTGDVDAFCDEITRVCNQPRMIVVDTLARSMLGGDENSARDMGLFIDQCDAIRQRFKCGVVIVHHTNKAGMYERGSGALRGAADSMIRVSLDDDLVVVECSKSKDHVPFDTMYKRLQPVDIELFDSDGNRLDLPVVAVDVDPKSLVSADGLTRLQRKVLMTVNETFEYGFTIAELSEVIPEVSRPNIHRVISRLRKLGYVNQPAKREPFELTDKGRDFCNAIENVSDISFVSQNAGSKSELNVSHVSHVSHVSCTVSIIPTRTPNDTNDTSDTNDTTNLNLDHSFGGQNDTSDTLWTTLRPNSYYSEGL